MHLIENPDLGLAIGGEGGENKNFCYVNAVGSNEQKLVLRNRRGG